MSLHEAAFRGDLDVVRQHIAAGSDLSERATSGGSCPLITAAIFGNTEVARALIEDCDGLVLVFGKDIVDPPGGTA